MRLKYGENRVARVMHVARPTATSSVFTGVAMNAALSSAEMTPTSLRARLAPGRGTSGHGVSGALRHSARGDGRPVYRMWKVLSAL